MSLEEYLVALSKEVNAIYKSLDTLNEIIKNQNNEKEKNDKFIKER